MSEMIINEDGSKGRINSVVFCYIKLQDGAFKYQSKTEKEYTVDCIVDKKTAKAYKKMFPKNSVKEIDTEEFEEKFKIPPVFPKEDEQYVLKIKADAQVKSDVPKVGLRKGDLIPYEWNTRPKIFVPVDGGVKDVTMEILVANGSKGSVAFKINDNDYGKFPQLTGILVTDLIEYEQKENQSDFGEVVGGLNPGDGDIKQVATVDEEGPVNNEPDGIPDDDFDEDSVPF